MNRGCPVCVHPRREEIDAALLAGGKVREVAAKFGGFSKSTAQKHKAAGHVAKPGERSPSDDEVLERVHALIDEVEQGVRYYSKRAGRDGDNRAAIAGMRELRETARLLADLAGKLRSRVTLNLLVDPRWIAFSGRLLNALAPFPDARAAVLGAMKETALLPVAAVVDVKPGDEQ